MSPSSIVFERRTPEYTLSVVRYAANREIAAHVHEQYGLSVVLDGAVVEEAEHQSASATAGWTASRPAGVVHTNRFGPDGATVLAVVPRGRMREGFPRHWSWSAAPAAYRAALGFLKSSRTASSFPGDALAEFLAALVPPPTRNGDERWLHSIRRTLDASDAAPSVAALASELGLHPVYLARRYRAAFGVSMREQRRIAQVRRAIQLVVRTNRPLSEIAHACGFADHSHMCRSFRRVTGWNPSTLRPGTQRR